ncbi:outer membrane protein transport protein [Prolixibacteraceae bacterium Z1-6]|uniref:Outer membrane protein transport protein n=1 Tax=Draconibacterium aestuarii TaxID=2998507 RepID=A0A9X3FBG4_9BACT|nr:outer membrane protein transport protein [Prolixibacteraceae bacterium Z1-6]
MKKSAILLLITLFVPFLISAQGVSDALRFSQFEVQGTARAGAMGNAFGALGGDFTSVSINPAGLGLYRSSEFAITPVSKHTKTESSYWGSNVDDTDYKFTLNNISYVSTLPTFKTNEAGLVSVNLGIGYNRLKDFSSNALAVGNGVDGSFMDYIASYANAGHWSDHYENLAWETYVLNYDEELDEYWTELGDAGYGQNQRKATSTSGSIDEYSFAIGLNFNHKFYLGASYGLTDVYYREAWQIYEVDAAGNIPYFNDFTFNNTLKTYGYGHNFKFGAIYKPVNEVRLGISLQTPTFYRLTDEHTTSMQSAIEDESGRLSNYEEYSPRNYYDYRLETPLRTTFSGAFIIAKKGLLSVDYELINYGSAKLRHGGDGYNFSDENMDISDSYKTAGNLRIGGEYRVNNAVSLRGGYQFQQSAYNSYALGASQPNSDANLNVISGGIGYRAGTFFVDVAYKYSFINDFALPYANPIEGRFTYPEPRWIEQKIINNDVLLTLGFKF